MRIVVMGAGGVGGYFGGRLALAGNDMTFIARGAHGEAIRRNGLRAEGTLGDQTSTMQVSNPGWTEIRHVGTLVGHSAVRLYAMGKDCSEREATSAELETMRRVVREALEAGALGLSITRNMNHFDIAGTRIPAACAPESELFALTDVLREVGTGVIQCGGGTNPELKDKLLSRISQACGRPIMYNTLLEQAPTIVALYRSPAFIAFLGALTGQTLQPCPPGDPHSCALYYYTEPGDHIGFHYDTSYYKGTRYTVLLGLVERSSSRLVCQLHKDDPAREVCELTLATEPGTLVLFHGDKLWHKITPLGENEERVSLTLEYVTDPGMTPVKRFVSNMKDAIAYFGFRSVFGTRRVD